MAPRAKIDRAGWVLVATLAGAWASERFGGESFAPIVLVASAPRGLWIGLAFAFVLVALAVRAWRSVGVGAAALALAIGPLGGFELRAGAAGPAGADARARTVRVVQYNVNKWDAGADAVARAILAMAPDVVCLEEAGAYRWLARDDQQPAALRRALPGWRFAGQGEILVATKLDVVAEHEEPLSPGPTSRPLVDAVVRAGGRELSVVCVHLIPTLPMESWAADRGEAASGSLVEIAAARRAQIERVRAYAASLRRPVVVCGDFNAVPGSRAIRSLEGTLDDAFRMGGSGFGLTAPARLPQQRIDYVFVRGLDVQSLAVGDATASDHRPVVADLALR